MERERLTAAQLESAGYVLANKAGERIERLEDQIRHMANVAHQAYHQDAGCGWLECPRAFCADARKALGSS